jgi:hypothetical protein
VAGAAVAASAYLPPSRSGPGVNPYGPSVDRVRLIFCPPDVHALSAFQGDPSAAANLVRHEQGIGSHPHFFWKFFREANTAHVQHLVAAFRGTRSLRLVPSRLRRVSSSKLEQPRRCKAAAALAKPGGTFDETPQPYLLSGAGWPSLASCGYPGAPAVFLAETPADVRSRVRP